MKLALLLFCLAGLFIQYLATDQKQDNCYLPDQCEIIDYHYWYESVLICKNLYAKLDEKRFNNETLHACKKFNYITTHGKHHFRMIIQPDNNDLSSRILKNSSSFEIYKILNSLGPMLRYKVWKLNEMTEQWEFFGNF